MLENLYNFKKELNKRGIFFCFSGPISQDLLVEIGDTLKNKMKLEDTSSSTILKVFSMFVEQTQNIIHYSAEKISNKPEETTELSSGIIVVGYENDHYFVLCGNMIDNESVKTLHEQLTTLQNMNKDELKRYYKEQRRKGTPETSKGAGLGFIELARKAVKPIEFNFQEVDDKFSFFSLKTVI
jgi:hypothetical protein